MTIDLDDIEGRISDGIWGDRETDTQRDDAFSALATLVAEVERLRAIIGDQQILLEDHQMDTRHAFDAGAWWRTCAADEVERGEHRREEEK
jgi:hypothetical protein